MAIPKYDELYLPLLKVLSDQNTHTNKEIINSLAEQLHLSPAELSEKYPSGTEPMFRSRVNWAITYLRKANLVISENRGHQKISSDGLQVLHNPPEIFDNNFLCQYPGFLSFWKHGSQDSTSPSQNTQSMESDETPTELIERAYCSINQKLSDDLMDEIMAKDPTFFEELVVKLLIKMGYGGSLSDAGIVTQKSNDGGIDGIIREDKLGFDKIYIQAKRWDPEKSISRPEIQKFSGALRDEGASKGLFITTASFSSGAIESAEKQHIVLVDGKRLTSLMIEYGLGVSTISTYEIKSIDTDFFNDDNA